jgi:hypothetical protein
MLLCETGAEMASEVNSYELKLHPNGIFWEQFGHVESR